MDTQSDVKVLNVTVEPMTQAQADEKLEEKNIADIAKTVEDTINGFSNEIPMNEKDARGFLGAFTDFIQSDTFRNDINEKAKKYGIPPRQLAKNFFTKILGIVGDILGIAVSTVGNVAHTIANVISTVLHSGVDLICRLASGISRIVTLNQSNLY